MNTLNYIYISHADNINRICMRYLEDVLNDQKSKLISSIKFLGLIVLTPIHYIYSIYSVNRFSVSYLEHFIKSNKLDEKGIKNFLKKEYHFFLRVKTIPLYYYKWEKDSIEESFDYFDRIYSFKQFTEVTRQCRSKFSTIDERHILPIFTCIKKLKLFKVDISQEDISDIFIKEKENIRLLVNHRGEFAHFFHTLYEHNLVSKKWASIAEKKGFFVNEDGKIIKAGTFSSSKTAHDFLSDKKEIIEECCKQILKC